MEKDINITPNPPSPEPACWTRSLLPPVDEFSPIVLENQLMIIRPDNQGPARPGKRSTSPVRAVSHRQNEETVLNLHCALRFSCRDLVRERHGIVAGPVTISADGLL